jgi:hypothetical protein
MVTKEQFDDWKELPVTQEFFNFVKTNLIQSRLNLMSVLTHLGNEDLNKIRDIYASNENIFNSILNISVGDINATAEQYKTISKNYKKELKEVLDVE